MLILYVLMGTPESGWCGKTERHAGHWFILKGSSEFCDGVR